MRRGGSVQSVQSLCRRAIREGRWKSRSPGMASRETYRKAREEVQGAPEPRRTRREDASQEEAGEVLGVAPATVMRDLRFAEAWLQKEKKHRARAA